MSVLLPSSTDPAVANRSISISDPLAALGTYVPPIREMRCQTEG